MHGGRENNKSRRESHVKHSYEEVDAAVLHPLSRRHRIRVLVLYFLLPALFVHFLQAAGALDYLEQKAFGLRMGIYTTRNSQLATEARKRIVLVPIADSTFLDAKFKRLREPPVPRSYHARVIRELTRAGAAVIVFDMLFDLSRPHDNALVKAAREAKAASTPVIWACLWNRDQQQFIFPLRQLQEASPHLGHARTPYAAQEPQVNRFETYVRNGPQKVPALSVEAVRLALNESLPVRRGDMWRAGSLAIPANPDGTFTVSFFGQAGETFPSVPYEQSTTGPSMTRPIRLIASSKIKSL
jgi:CHASE2 domain-containing sensor protein